MNQNQVDARELAELLAELRRHRALQRRQLGLVVAAVVVGAGTSVFAGAPALLTKLLLRAGPPGPTEIVPRQLAYSGVLLDQTGAPVTNPAVGMTLKLLSQDGGTLHSEAFTAPVQNGRFRLELGDSAAIASSTFAAPYLDVELTIGGQKLAKQRVLSVPFAMRSGDVITEPMTITVGAGAFMKLEDAITWLRTKTLRAPVTVHIPDGTYAMPVGGILLNHSDGALISIVGNMTTPGNVVLNVMGADFGFILNNGHQLRALDGLHLSGAGVAGSTALQITDGASATLGPNVLMTNFDNVVSIERHALVNVKGGTFSGRGTGLGGCFLVDTGSHLDVVDLTASNCSVAIFADKRSSALIRSGTISTVYGAVWASQGSAISAAQMTISGISGGGSVAFRAANSSIIHIAGSNATGGCCSPAASTGGATTFGNANGLITY